MCRLSLPGTEGLVVQSTIYLNINLSMTEGERRPAEISVDGLYSLRYGRYMPELGYTSSPSVSYK